MAVQPVINKPAAPRTPKEPERNSFQVATTSGHTTEWDDVSASVLTHEDTARLNTYWRKYCEGYMWNRAKAEAVKIILQTRPNATLPQVVAALRAMDGMKERTVKKYLSALRPTTRGPKSPSPGTKKYKRK